MKMDLWFAVKSTLRWTDDVVKAKKARKQEEHEDGLMV